MTLRALLVMFSASLSLPLQAEIIELVIPVVVRAPSASGTDWRTDLYVTNATPLQSRVNIAYFTNGQRQDEVRVVGPHSSLTIPDIVGFFGHERGSGILRIESPIPFVTARARIYRIGLEKGDVGQIVPARERLSLPGASFLGGLEAGAGISVNVGVANPNNAATEAYLTVFDAKGEPHYFLTHTVPENGFVQINDILRGLPAGSDYTIEIVTLTGGYAYASVVHGSQDADFIPASDFVRGF